MLKTIDKTNKSFTFSLEAKNCTTFWCCNLNKVGAGILEMDLPLMVEYGLKFNVVNLGTTHHKFSLNIFTANRMAEMEINTLLHNLVDKNAITQNDRAKIIKELELNKEIAQEMGI